MEIKTKGIELPNGDSYVFIPPDPTETESGGIKAKNKTNENREVAVDPKTGKAYVYVDDKADKEVVEQNIAALTDKTNTLAPGIVLDAKGGAIAVSNASEQPFVGLNVYGKSTQVKTTGAQLLRHPYAIETATKNGVTVTSNKDGSITLTGTSDGGSVFELYSAKEPLIIPAGTYSKKSKIKDGAFLVYYNRENTVQLLDTFVVDKNTDLRLVLNVNSGCTINETFYPMLNAGETLKPWEPYTGCKPSPSLEYQQDIVNAGEGGSITVEVKGRNLLKPNSYNTYYEFPLKANTVITLMTNGKPSQGGNIKFSATDGSNVWFSIDTGQTRVCRSIGNKDVKGFYDLLKVGGGLEYMFAVGDIKTYTPYVEPQSITLATPNGLAGIPVTTGGNYVDENGQQWVCDEIDLEKEERIQRIGECVFDGSEDWFADYISNQATKRYRTRIPDIIRKKQPDEALCSHFSFAGYSDDRIGFFLTANNADFYLKTMFETVDELKKWLSNNNVTVKYILETPIRTPLSPEEIAAYKALHTYSGTTIIFNDSDADSFVKYVVDTKKYLEPMENEIKELASSKNQIAKNKENIAFLTDTTMSWSDWFDLHRTGWHGGVTYPRSKVSTSTLGTKTGDNTDMVVEVSTNVTKGRNDFANSPVTNLMFNGIEVNGYVDEEGEPHITAVKGSNKFSRDGSNGDVYMAFLTPFYKRIYSEEVDGWDFADHPIPGYKPWDAAVRPDGTYRSFYFVSKYPGVEGLDGNVASISGKKVIRNVSHNNQIDKFKKKGSQYCGMTSIDVAWTQWMADMKFANRNSTSIMSGCTSYWHQVPAAVEEDNVKRIIIPKTNANKLIVGSCVSIGYGTVINEENKPDRAYTNTHAYADDVKILRIEDYDSDNSAVYVDAPEPFSTRQVQLNDTITSPVYLTSMYWQSGACDNVLGCDGSPANPAKNEYPFILSGVELGHGGYVVIADVILNGIYNKDDDVYTQTPYVVSDSRKIATSLTDDYKEVGYNLPDTNNAGNYISDLGYDSKFPWLGLPITIGASSSTCYGDYVNTGQRANGLREWLWFGGLGNGSSTGLRCVAANYSVGFSWWLISLRLSSLRH